MSKNARGLAYRTNVWKIESEFENADSYDVPSGLDLEAFFESDAFMTRIDDEGVELEDMSAIFENVKHSLELIEALARCVHVARRRLVVIRRVPENSGPVLMLQRQNALTGLVGEESPLALIALYREKKLLLTQDLVPGESTLTRMLLNFVGNEDTCAVCGDLLRNAQSTMLSCRHELHTACLLSILEKSKGGEKAKCPDCTHPRARIARERVAVDAATEKLDDLKYHTQMRAITAMMEAAGLTPNPAALT